MTDISGYRLLFDPPRTAPTRPARTTVLSRSVAFTRNVLITYALAVIVVFAWRHEFSRFLVQPLLDALREALYPRGFTTPYHFHYPTPAIYLIAALLLAAPILAIQTWILFARRAFGPETLRVAWWRAVLAIGGFAAGTALGHYLIFPLIWPLFPLFDLTVGHPIATVRYFSEFGWLHAGTMLLGGLAVQAPVLVTLLKRRRVRA